MERYEKVKKSTNLLLPIQPRPISTIFGKDFDVSGYVRKVEILNEGKMEFPLPLDKKMEIHCVEGWSS